MITILVVEDDAGLREALVDTLELAHFAVLTAASGSEALGVLRGHSVDLIVSDVQMADGDGFALLHAVRRQWPQLPILLMTAYATIDDAVRAMREGATDYLAKPFAPQVLVNMVSRYAPQPRTDRVDPVVADERSRELLALAVRVAASDANVMVLGPSGTGKEVLARYIHQQSPRADAPFIAINCAAIPDNMLEATLFGYDKGAFTGALQACPGKFEQAEGGTLLLDEITEMDLNLQAKLLRVIQEREVERLGSRKTIRLNVRVVATSNRDLRQAVASGCFREDLFYRLNVFPLRWPALWERPADILPLAEHLLARHCARSGRRQPLLTPAARQRLQQHDWPGNVRELDNVIQRALILASGDRIDEESLLLGDEPLTMAAASINPPPALGLGDDEVELNDELRDREHQVILTMLDRCQGNRQSVAERLGISPRTLRYKLARMREAGIQIPG
ncbi:MAG: sigma-54-dependent Fis family transcriptional regulator [Gammaproteobacteria bacterium]|nr:sigma-54-dependent Fis family transcriptional regulator [Gammaproteobacteria bacterium]